MGPRGPYVEDRLRLMRASESRTVSGVVCVLFASNSGGGDSPWVAFVDLARLATLPWQKPILDAINEARNAANHHSSVLNLDNVETEEDEREPDIWDLPHAPLPVFVDECVTVYIE